jgi:hypothetical protein
MAKEKPYPLRLEPPQESKVQEICRATGLSKAYVLRLAIDVGLNAVDWDRLKTPPLVSDVVYTKQKKSAAGAMSHPPQRINTVLNDSTARKVKPEKP